MTPLRNMKKAQLLSHRCKRLLKSRTTTNKPPVDREIAPWFIQLVPNEADRNRIINVIKVEQSGYDQNGNRQIQRGKNGGC